ncbi:hypothetical protein [uncultured Aquimarina sp.]|uniref:hypothetical protein n=1 Tax=uncultured Aquimarina sp. TaxID=575652 RepID=UPI002629D1DB|nr:hypothetical protein [uncultured Aquimarina sp.]
MNRLIIHRTNFVIALLLLFKFNSNAQGSNIVYYENNKIAVKHQNDSIYFYNSLGAIRKIISLKNNKSTPFGLPQEVQEIIYNGEIPEKVEISGETFPTYLYKKRYTDAGIVLCSERIYYNKLGLKTGYEEICPDDTGGSDYHFGGKNIYKYNQYGLLIEKEGVIYNYNNYGQLIQKKNRNISSKKVYRDAKYKYNQGKLFECTIDIINSNPEYNKTLKLKYKYNNKGLLSEIIKNSRKKIVIEYNNDNNVTKVSEVKNWRDKKYEHTYLTYYYDTKKRIERIQIDHQYSYSDQDLRFMYDEDENLVQKILNGKIIESFGYDDKGTLIYIGSNERWGEDKVLVKY